MEAITLRRAGMADAEALADLGRASFCETFVDGFGVPYPPDDLSAFLQASYSPHAFRSKLADPDQAVWIAVGSGGEALAYACAGPCTLPHPQAERGHAELSRLYVLASAQGRGLGRHLFEAALDWMAAWSSGPLWLGVWSQNLKAQRFYERHGFRRVGEYVFPVGGWKDLDFIYRRD